MDDRWREVTMSTDDGLKERSMEWKLRRRGRLSVFLPPVALVTVMTGATPAGPTGRDAPPILTSLGVTREDGTPLGVIGGRERFRLQAPPGKAFREVVWMIEGAIAKQEVSADRGFVNTPLPNPLRMRPPEDATESIVEFYWNGLGGHHSIRVTAVYPDGSAGTPDGFSIPSRD
jgi:hypothetical protein